MLLNLEEVGTTAVTIREQSFPKSLIETCSVSHIRRGNALIESFGLGGMILWKRGVQKLQPVSLLGKASAMYRCKDTSSFSNAELAQLNLQLSSQHF
ncbi:uncharacterized protein Bfra_009047 [Botrytis fragariae]|uniref:Uncharacterized protein n=1 Tax=Botrytis fragariae TaxID=1964551 RepID=A0A8H6ARG4_9HELO|nr:uncharacterized protein Bfra_009047 [Botrytis fragariae]KAF5872020.1 hypothetical protein Bfra_009047 [Botrytis fragariae]